MSRPALAKRRYYTPLWSAKGQGEMPAEWLVLPACLNQVTVPARDLSASVAFYQRLGLELIVTSAHYARFKCPAGDATFSVHLAQGIPASSQTIVYFETAALDERVKQLQAAGLSFAQEPRDEPWLWREARLLDPSGNIICLYWLAKIVSTL